MSLVKIQSVFVPFELQPNGQWKKRDDLPRFLEPEEVIQYLGRNPQVSYRWNGPIEERHRGHTRRVEVVLEWREHSEPDLIKEFTDGVGTPEFNRKRRMH